MRYALLTTEFPTTLHGAGGLATYTRRMSALLAEVGHEVEVFVLDAARADTVRQDGYTVRHVRHRPGRLARLHRKVTRKLGIPGPAESHELRAGSEAIAAALEARHVQARFDVVQSPDHFGLGTAVARIPGRVHIVRCSAAMDLYMTADGRADPKAAAQIEAERTAVALADLAIAPSDLVARHYARIVGRKVHVVRPPAYLEESPGLRPSWLPDRYLVHFAGWLGPRKGTELIAKALVDVIKAAPDFVMVWIGRMPSGEAGRRLQRVDNTRVLKSGPLGKAELYAVLQGATAAVLPSQVDNIPNTMIESLLLGTPLICSAGASQDELVTPGPGARLIPLGDASSLAEALISAWRGELGVAPRAWLETPQGAAFRPEVALEAHLSLLKEVRIVDEARMTWPL